MAFGIPSTNPSFPSSLEVLQTKSKAGLQMSVGGVMYMQYAASAALVNSVVETSILNSSVTTAQGSLVIPAGALAWGSALNLVNAPGCLLRVKLFGNVTITSTPTLRIRVGMVNAAGTFLPLTDSTALTAAAVTGGLFELYSDIAVSSYGSAGIIAAGGNFMQSVTAISFQRFILPYTATSAFDTTVPYTLDVRATWGTAAAGNSLTVVGGYVEMIN
jgi:hypothetical protein